ncbi:sensor histidine kinase [Propionibacterium australiense]|nr:sensor histidine kinase [Propionibacterium australiense]SYZ34349.1 histidine kinase [Propionibacterium australiense]VEH90058.1 Oxygen sensor histidine kinase nreB [Propionibacterium australiense]
MTGHHAPATDGQRPAGRTTLPVTELVGSLADVVAQVHATLGPDQSGLCVHRCLTATRCQTVQMQVRPAEELQPMTCLLDPGSTCILTGPRLKCPRAMDEKDVVRVGLGTDDEFGWLWHARLGGTDPSRRQAEELVLVAMAGMAERLIARAVRADDSEARMIANERERISRELHDGVAQVLGSAHLRLSSLAERGEFGDETARELTQIGQDCAMAYSDVREAIWDLRMPEEMTGSLSSGIQSAAGAFERRSGITCRLELAEPDVPLAAGARLQLLRVVQEALTNVRKHAHARSVDLTMRANPSSITVNISDDGIGFEDPAPGPGRFGLLSMRERIEEIGGHLSIMSIPGAGTCVSAVVPLAVSDEGLREERTHA